MRVLITRPVPAVGPRMLEAAGHEVVMRAGDRAISGEELLAALVEVEGMIALPTDRITAELLDARPKLRAVANMAVGYNNIDVAASTARKVGVSNTPDVLTNATAEVAFLLMLAAARRTGEGERMLRAGAWKGLGPFVLLGMDVVGQTLGIVGAGRIGGRVARMAAGFEMRVVYHNRKPSAEMEALGAKWMPLEGLLKTADFVSVHTPLSAQTRHLIGAKELALMKPTAVLVNTSRGAVVDEGALVESLRARRIFAAGLDVYEEEPAVHPGLLELENVVLLPHIGSATVTTRGKMAELAAENLIEMLAGRRPGNAVNPEVW